jgi:fumarate reductase subunit D
VSTAGTVEDRQHHGEWHEREDLKPNVFHGFWWFMFGNGGALAAIFLPVHELVQGILGPAFNVPYWNEDAKHMSWVLGNPIIKLYLIVLCGFTFVHFAHRFIYAMGDVGLLAIRRPLSWVLYAAAVVATLVAAFLLITAP